MIERLQAAHHGHKCRKTLCMSREDIEIRTKRLNITEVNKQYFLKQNTALGRRKIKIIPHSPTAH
jgi:hypothetical protein